MTIADEIKQEGRQEGRQEEREFLALRMIADGIEIETISRYVELTPEQLEKLRRQQDT